MNSDIFRPGQSKAGRLPGAVLAGLVVLALVSCTHPRAASEAARHASGVPVAGDGTAWTASLAPAKVRSALVASFNKHDDSLISVNQHLKGGCLGTRSTQRLLFVVTSSETTPEGYVDIEVADGRSTRLLYTESYMRSTCSLAYEVALKPGGRYVMQGGRGYREGATSILTGGHVCSLQIRDEETSLPVPVKPMKIGDFCRRYAPANLAPASEPVGHD